MKFQQFLHTQDFVLPQLPQVLSSIKNITHWHTYWHLITKPITKTPNFHPPKTKGFQPRMVGSLLHLRPVMKIDNDKEMLTELNNPSDVHRKGLKLILELIVLAYHYCQQKKPVMTTGLSVGL